MKKSINAWAFPADMDFEQVLKTAKEYGFEAVEFNVDEPGKSLHSFSLNTTDEELAKVKALIEKYGIEVQSVSTGLYWTIPPFASKNEEDRAQALKVLRKQIYCAKAIGAEAILVVTSVDKEIGLKASFDNTIAVFRSLKDEIAQSGIKIGLENVWNNFFSSPMDVRYVLDGINDKNVGIYFDMGNVIEFSETDWWLDVIGNDIVKIHIKDFRRNYNATHSGGEFCALLEGHTNYKKAMPVLKSFGYDGAITVELFPKPDVDFYEFLTKASKSAGEIIAMAK